MLIGDSRTQFDSEIIFAKSCKKSNINLLNYMLALTLSYEILIDLH